MPALVSPHPMVGHWLEAAGEEHSLGVNVAMDPKASEAADWQISTQLTTDSLSKGDLSSAFPWLPHP